MKNQRIKTDKLGRRQYSKNERRKLVRKFERSGMTQVAFSKANGLVSTTLAGWIRSLGSKKKKEFPVEFAEVELSPAVPDICAELIYPDGRVLHLRNMQPSADHASFIRQVLSC
jgi:transposase-like protein